MTKKENFVGKFHNIQLPFHASYFRHNTFLFILKICRKRKEKKSFQEAVSGIKENEKKNVLCTYFIKHIF